MLSIFILNVGQGDSIVIEYQGPNGKSYGIIDSCCKDDQVPRALEKLKVLGATKISFVVLTHPHKDHYSGLYKILNEYRGRVSSFYSFPFDHQKEDQLKKYSKAVKKIIDDTDSVSKISNVIEFLNILKFVQDDIGLDNWDEPVGFESTMRPDGFEDVEISSVLPPRRVRANLFEALKEGSTDLVKRDKENHLSLAIQIKYKDNTVILGGMEQPRIGGIVGKYFLNPKMILVR